MEKYEIVRCLEESPKVMGLNLKTAIFIILIILLSLLMIIKSVFSLGLNVLAIVLIKFNKRFSQKGSFEMYVDKISRPKNIYVFDYDISNYIKK